MLQHVPALLVLPLGSAALGKPLFTKPYSSTTHVCSVHGCAAGTGQGDQQRRTNQTKPVNLALLQVLRRRITKRQPSLSFPANIPATFPPFTTFSAHSILLFGHRDKVDDDDCLLMDV